MQVAYLGVEENPSRSVGVRQKGRTIDKTASSNQKLLRRTGTECHRGLFGTSMKWCLSTLTTGRWWCWCISTSTHIILWMSSMRAAPVRANSLVLSTCQETSKAIFSDKRKPLGQEAQVLAGSQDPGSGQWHGKDVGTWTIAPAVTTCITNPSSRALQYFLE